MIACSREYKYGFCDLLWTFIDYVLHCCNGTCTCCSRARVMYLVSIPLSPHQTLKLSFPGQWRFTHIFSTAGGGECDLLLWYIGWVYSMCNNFSTMFRERYYNCQQEVCSLWGLDDWKQELSRTGCQGWRLSAVNHSFQLSTRWSLLCTRSRLFSFVVCLFICLFVSFFVSSFLFIVKYKINLLVLGNRFQFR